MTRTVEISGNTYSIPRLTPWDAFHVMRRIGPLLVGIGPQILGLALVKDEAAKAAGLLQSLFGDAGMRFSQVLSVLPEADLDAVAMTCLKNVTVLNHGKAARVIADGMARPQPMFPFVNLTVMIRLISEVMKEELTDFLTAGRSFESGETQTTQT